MIFFLITPNCHFHLFLALVLKFFFFEQIRHEVLRKVSNLALNKGPFPNMYHHLNAVLTQIHLIH